MDSSRPVKRERESKRGRERERERERAREGERERALVMSPADGKWGLQPARLMGFRGAFCRPFIQSFKLI